MSDTDTPAEETAGFFEAMTALPVPTVYTEMDRYRDFRKVFMGSDEGKRVMRELLAWGHMFRTSVPGGGQIDPYRMAVSEGERNIALKLLATINVEPRSRPTRANSKPKDE